MEPDVGSPEQRARAALSALPRRDFLPRRQHRFADDDRALSIGHGSTCSQPTTVLHLLTALDARPGHRVLDVGSGSGWTTALLAHLVAPAGRVLGVERVPALVEYGAARLAAARGTVGREPDEPDKPDGPDEAAIVRARPGVLGWPEQAPYDRILVSADAATVPPSLVDQLAPAGVLVGPFGGQLCRVTRTGDGEVDVERRGSTRSCR
ncbi:protein-L-isoaspartate O-methyltransferase family protein [Nocardioides sambongensis]|uniref:protein-L-isoaspartate O-methyltransferase family protein n=1 Tax=Nocardioides sambongensis TaxID=2589074 RepID=UPI0018C87A52|nr:protein-L-isoaspartate carboxylmethyltransferase [Nocardioides sambongensis]